MSTHLRLYPLLRGPAVLQDTFINILTVLDPGQNYKLYAQIDVLNFRDTSVLVTVKTYPIPPQCFVQFEEEGRPTRENKGGGDIYFAYAKELKKWEIPTSAHFSAHAVKGYIDNLPDEIPIILYF